MSPTAPNERPNPREAAGENRDDRRAQVGRSDRRGHEEAEQGPIEAPRVALPAIHFFMRRVDGTRFTRQTASAQPRERP